MTIVRSTGAPAFLEIRSVWSRAAHLVRSRLGLVALGAAIVVIGGALNWHWLVAAGVAPLVLSVLPCVVMCSLGLCMVAMTNRSANSGRPANSKAAALSGPSGRCAPEAIVEPSQINPQQW